MSEASNSVNAEDKNEQASQPEEAFVPKTAYEEVTADMHKYKSKMKEAQAKINEFEARLKAQEEEKLKEQNRWKELYENEQQEKARLEEERQRDRQLYLESAKLSALKTELGGEVRPEYLRFAKLEEIQIDESGSLSSESVKAVANQFRQEHPSLIPAKNDVNITSAPAANSTNFNQPQKDVSQMNLNELQQAIIKMRENQ